MASIKQKTADSGHTIGTESIPWAEVHSKQLKVQGDATITGDLTVVGSNTTVDVQNLVVEDNLIKIAKINEGSATDVGIFAAVDTTDTGAFDSGNTMFTGLVKDQSHTDKAWRLFKTKAEADNLDLSSVTTTVNFDHASVEYDVLEANLQVPESGYLKVPVASGTLTDYITAVTLGTAKANKVLTVDANKDISGIATLTAQTLSAGNITLNGSDISVSGGSPAFSSIDVNGGAIDGTPIGANDASTGAFTTLGASGITTLSGDASVAGATSLNGNVTLGNATGDDIVITGRLNSDIIPKTDSARDLGTSALRMRHVYSDQITASTINAFSAGGPVNFTNKAMSNVNVTSGAIEGADITLSSGNTLDVSAGTITFLPGQVINADLATINTADKVSLDALDIDGATEMGAALVDADLFIVDDGGAGTEKSMLASRIPTYVISKLSGGTGVSHSGGEFSIGQAVATSSDVTFNTVTASTFTGVVTDISNHTTADLAENSNLYYTDERVDDRVNALITDGQAIGTTYNDTAGTLTIAVDTASTTGLGVASFSSDDFDVSAGGAVTVKADAITNDQLENIDVGSVKVGGASNAPTDLDLSAEANILVGQGTSQPLQAVALNGDVSMTKAGLVTIGSNKVSYDKIQEISTDLRLLGRNHASTKTVTEVQVQTDMIADDQVTAAKLDDLLTDNSGTAGSYGSAAAVGSFTVDAQGRLTAASSTNISIDHSQVSDFDTGVRENRLDQMTAPTAEVSLASQKITDLATPSAANDAANKSYVDGVAQGLKVHDNVKLATTANGTLASAFANGETIDGVALETSDRILIKNQTDASENGIYVVQASGAPSRASDMDAGAEFAGSFVFVTHGTENADCSFVCTVEPDNFTLGTTNVTWAQFASAGQITASTGLSKSGNSISITPLALSRAVVSDGSGNLSASAVTSTEVSYLDGVTSGIQAQIDSKQATLTGATTTLVASDLTAGRALLSNGSGKIAVSDVTSTELGYLDGVSSNIQTQFNAKQGLNANLTALNTCQSGAAAALALLTSTEVEILDGADLSTAELNRVKGVTSAIQTQLDAKHPTIDSTARLNANLIADGSVDNTEFAYLHGVSSAIQTQIDAKAPIANPTFTGEIGIGSVNVSEAELGILEGATISTTELNHLGSVSSAIQTQLDNKQPKDDELTELATMDSATASALADLSGTQVAFLNGASLGAAVGGKALVVNSEKDITSINSLTAATLVGTTVKVDDSNKLEATGLTANQLVVDSITINDETISSSGNLILNCTGTSSKIKLNTNDDLELQGTGGDLTVGGDTHFARGIFNTIGEAKTDNHTLADGEHIVLFDLSIAGGDRTITLQASDNGAITNRIIKIKNIGSSNTVKFASTSQIDGAAASAHAGLTSGQKITLIATPENGWQSI